MGKLPRPAVPLAPSPSGLIRAPHPPMMGILPLGTGNDLSRTLRLPLDPNAAWQVIRHGGRRQIDLVRINTLIHETVFTNVAGGGNSIRVMDCINPELKKRWGPWCYLRGAIGALTDLKGFRMRLTFPENDPRDERVWFHQTNRLELEIQPACKLVADGEPLEGERFHFSVLPSALPVVVGPDYR